MLTWHLCLKWLATLLERPWVAWASRYQPQPSQACYLEVYACSELPPSHLGPNLMYLSYLIYIPPYQEQLLPLLMAAWLERSCFSCSVPLHPRKKTSALLGGSEACLKAVVTGAVPLGPKVGPRAPHAHAPLLHKMP